jgi:hypothetical protein
VDGKKALEVFGFKFCKSLLEEGATYASVILSNNNSIIHKYSTNKVWEGLYIESGFSNSCHLFSATKYLIEKNDSFILFWDSLIPNNEISHYLNAKRKEKNVYHGTSFCTKNKSGILEILSIAGRACDLNFATQVVSNKKKIQNQLLG